MAENTASTASQTPQTAAPQTAPGTAQMMQKVAASTAPIWAESLNNQLHPENGEAPNYEACFQIASVLLKDLRTLTGKTITRKRKNGSTK